MFLIKCQEQPGSPSSQAGLTPPSRRVGPGSWGGHGFPETILHIRLPTSPWKSHVLLPAWFPSPAWPWQTAPGPECAGCRGCCRQPWRSALKFPQPLWLRASAKGVDVASSETPSSGLLGSRTSLPCCRWTCQVHPMATQTVLCRTSDQMPGFLPSGKQHGR